MDYIERLHANIRLLIPESDGRYFSPGELDRVINLSILDIFNQHFKVYEESQRITDLLSRYKITTPVVVSGGVAVLPPVGVAQLCGPD